MNKVMTVLCMPFLLGLGLPALGCGTSTPPKTDAEKPERFAKIAAIHKSKCGSCHTRIEPGSMPRDELEAELKRHRSRVKLSEAEWAEMLDYLAADSKSRER
ncbi:MAG TPA: hypothetical protein PKL24_06690 [Polyangiaceae bacterium]|jgi:mono/diheme cytochrome c family protein|nr:MAG: hypothetical protein BWY17_00725 [Deltaproteobacteria bacterium ADurb.Bin207]HNZ21811.1 hypothetical protein [Polyangiaceae bacterium]HOE50694.1 hypothetical protein [Polyangiaceae bacterium]HOG99628.1 hypothetical protein [Polyangiaceae bacterium]HOT09171.1 hypothetical protein [Polyangiaceae bacterium]